MNRWSDIKDRLTAFDCAIYTFDMLLTVKTGRTLNAPRSKAHSEQNTRSASDISIHTAPITKPASLLTRRSQSHREDQSVLGCDGVSPLGKSFSTFQKHYNPSKHQRHSSNNKHHVQQHCCDNLPSPSFHPCHI